MSTNVASRLFKLAIYTSYELADDKLLVIIPLFLFLFLVI